MREDCTEPLLARRREAGLKDAFGRVEKVEADGGNISRGERPPPEPPVKTRMLAFRTATVRLMIPE